MSRTIRTLRQKRTGISGADGESHYYIDGTVLVSDVLPILMVDTETDMYYRVTETGNWLILPYDEENA